MTYSNKKADGLILSSSYLERYYKKKKTIVCPPLIDISDQKWSVKKDKDGIDRTFVYFGSGGRVKEDLKSIVDNFEKLDSFNLNIVGLTQDVYESDYRVQHKSYPNIKFWGRIEHEKALGIVANSDCSIILRKPTRKNNAGFPTKFVESISLGIPVLCNDFSDVKKYFANNNGKIIHYNEIEDGLLHFFDNEIIVDRTTFDIAKYTKLFDEFLNQIGS